MAAIDGGQFNLSLTPGVSETRHILDGPSEPPRIATWAVLLDRETNQEIVAVNTHFQPRSQRDARGGETLENLQNKLSPDGFEGLKADLNLFNSFYAEDGPVGQVLGGDQRFQGADLTALDAIPGASEILIAEIE